MTKLLAAVGLALIAFAGVLGCGVLLSPVGVGQAAPVEALAPVVVARGGMDGWQAGFLVGLLLIIFGLFLLAHFKRMDHAVAMRQASHAPPPHILHMHPTEPARPPAEKETPLLPGPEPGALSLPGLVTLTDLLGQGWAPTRDRVLLGLGPGGVRYEVPADDKLCHVLTVGRTGHGKSSFNRLLLPQLIALGFDVYLLDCDYTPVDPKTGEEWAPLAARTAPGRAIFDPAEIMATMLDAEAEVERRHDRRRAGAPMGTPRFYAIEEGPEVVARYPEFMDHAAKVLRRGRRVEIYLLFIAQSALIKVIGGNSGDRGQFGTVAYVGGEPVSARAIFEEKGLPEPVGRGVARLRCFGQPGSVEARIPYGDNAGISQLLARYPTASAARFAPGAPASAPGVPSAAVYEPEVIDGGELVSDLGDLLDHNGRPLPPDLIAQVRERYDRGLSSSDTLKDITGGKTGGDAAAKVGRIYHALVQQTRADLARVRQN